MGPPVRLAGPLGTGPYPEGFHGLIPPYSFLCVDSLPFLKKDLITLSRCCQSGMI
jgi:hypothetical protein